MQAVGKAVGDGQPNEVSDVTLIQAALVKIAGPAGKGRPAGHYLASYNGALRLAFGGMTGSRPLSRSEL